MDLHTYNPSLPTEQIWKVRISDDGTHKAFHTRSRNHSNFFEHVKNHLHHATLKPRPHWTLLTAIIMCFGSKPLPIQRDSHHPPKPISEN